MFKSKPIYLTIWLLVFAAAFSGCRRNTDSVWEDTKSAGRHVNRGFRTLGGKHDSSRAVRDPSDFCAIQDGEANYNLPQTGSPGDYIPLADAENGDDVAMADYVAPQPRETPGEAGSSIPGIDAFRDPSTIPQLAGIFKNVYFEYNSNLIKGQTNLETVRDVANYLRTHPNMYIFVAGHTDERGPDAYNLALGSRRSNSVRNMLIQEGVNPDNIFTISYGRERPLVMEHHDEAWSQNRRAEFLVYSR